MKAVGLFLLALLAIAFLDGAVDAYKRRGGDPAAVHDGSVAAGLVRSEQGMRRYLTDTPAELDRLRSERAAHLRTLCRAGYVEPAYCGSLDKPK